MKQIGIRKKLVAYFLSIVSVLVFVNVLFFFLHIFVVEKYEKISSNIFNQYELISATSDLVSSYNVYRNAQTEDRLETYNNNKEVIKDLIVGLKETVVSQDSKAILSGVENTISSVVLETDTGITELKEGNAQNLASHFIEANRKLYFVKENTASLILSEVKYSAELKTRVARINTLSFLFGGIFLLIVVAGVIVLSNIWATQLILPLVKLANLAQIITGGKMESDVDPELMKSKDEVGSLAQAFDLMLKKLRGNIAELNTSNKELEVSKKQIEENNIYLGKTNKMMVDRELAMIKLKKKVKILTDAGPVSYEVSDKLAKVDVEDSIDALK
jgi:nitrogen fixation/metabolism regulation signal transduction histidine kinase